MATDTSIIITYLDPNNKSGQRSIKNINPQAATDKVVLWAKAMVAVTSNSYVSTAIIYKIKLD